MIRRLTGLGLCLPLVIFFAACGGGSSTPSTPSTPAPTPKATPTPDPNPTPTPDPNATPCTVGLCEPETTNTSQPARVILRLYQLFDKEGTWVLPTPDPVKQVVNRMTGRKVGDEIIQEYRMDDGNRCQWLFTQITADAFHWINRVSADDGKSWEIRGEFFLKRRAE